MAASEQSPALERLLADQIAYYRRRAGEYDEWFLRQGRYDHGPELNRRWFDEVAQVGRALADLDPRGRVLELAGGTGLWTERLIEHADTVTVVDAFPEVLAINRDRIARRGALERVRYVEADLFAWRPTERHDLVSFTFWLSHVPPERFDAFWDAVAAAIAPGGRFFFADSRHNPTSTASDHRLGGPEQTTALRRLNDGSEFTIVKVFYEPAALAGRLAHLGWRAEVRATPSYFIYGWGERT